MNMWTPWPWPYLSAGHTWVLSRAPPRCSVTCSSNRQALWLATLAVLYQTTSLPNLLGRKIIRPCQMIHNFFLPTHADSCNQDPKKRFNLCRKYFCRHFPTSAHYLLTSSYFHSPDQDKNNADLLTEKRFTRGYRVKSVGHGPQETGRFVVCIVTGRVHVLFLTRLLQTARG